MSTERVHPIWCTMALFLGFGMGILFGYFIGSSAASATWIETMVKHDIAEYYLDAEHQRQWRFKKLSGAAP